MSSHHYHSDSDHRPGVLIGGSTHLEKVVEVRERYARILRRGGLSPEDQAVAQSRYNAYHDFAQEHDLDAMMKARGLRCRRRISLLRGDDAPQQRA